MRKLTQTLLAIALFIGAGLQAQEVTAPKFGKGILNLKGQNNSWSMKIGARMQFLTTNTWDINDGNYGRPQNSMLVRRARLKFSGFAFTPKLKYKLELGLSNKDMGGATKYTNNAPRYILDAVVKWNFYQNFSLWVGQTKLPGNRERVVSSGNLQFVDRSFLNKKFNLDRDLGLQLRHYFNLSDTFVVREVFSVSQGEGRNIVKGNQGGHQYTGRIELLPLGNFKSKGDYFGSDLKREETPKLAIGATYSFNDDTRKLDKKIGEYKDGIYDISTVFVDAMFKYQGFSFMGEYADRRNEKVSDKTVKGDYSTNLQAGYLFKNNVELAGRYTHYKCKGEDFSTNFYTLGLSKYIVGHKLKVQTDITYKDITGTEKGGLEYRLQLDIHF
ncbi:MAG: porin [Flavobacteriaceae bacterium]|nr:porin [Flavobacteriaceae bacterium]